MNSTLVLIAFLASADTIPVAEYDGVSIEIEQRRIQHTPLFGVPHKLWQFVNDAVIEIEMGKRGISVSDERIAETQKAIFGEIIDEGIQAALDFETAMDKALRERLVRPNDSDEIYAKYLSELRMPLEQWNATWKYFPDEESIDRRPFPRTAEEFRKLNFEAYARKHLLRFELAAAIQDKEGMDGEDYWDCYKESFGIVAGSENYAHELIGFEQEFQSRELRYWFAKKILDGEITFIEADAGEFFEQKAKQDILYGRDNPCD